MTGAVVLAAGDGSRFGATKQLAELDGAPLLEHVLRTLAEAPVDRTVVVLGADAERVGAIDLHGAVPTVCERWEEGQSASLAAGLADLADADRAVVALGDQPRLAVESVRRVLEALDGGARAARATYGGRPGHPVAVDRSLFGELSEVTGDRGGRDVLARVGAVEVACDDLGGGEDVDTPEQLESM